MEKTLNTLHDLFTTMKKEGKRYIQIVEPKTTNPSNDFERMLVRKALGIEETRKKRVKQLQYKLSEWLDKGSLDDLIDDELVQLYADIQLETFALKGFSSNLEDAKVLGYETSEHDLDKMQHNVQSQLEELQDVLTDIRSRWKDSASSDAEESIETVEASRPNFSVGSLL